MNLLLKVFEAKRLSPSFAASEIESWVLPLWFTKQSNPLNPGCVFDGYRFANISYRNWTALYNAGGEQILTVDRDGTISFSLMGVSVEIWVNNGETLFTPGRFLRTEQKAAVEFPCIETRSIFPKGTCISRVFIIDQCRNVSFGIELELDTPEEYAFDDFSIFLVARPYDHDGITGINRLEYKNKQLKVNNSELFQSEIEPKVIYCTHARLGDVTEYFKLGQNRLAATSTDGSCTGLIGYSIRPGEQNKIKLFYKTDPFKRFSKNETDFSRAWLDDSRQDWISRYIYQHRLLKAGSKTDFLYHTNLNYLIMFSGPSSDLIDVYHILALNRFALASRSRNYLLKAIKNVRWDGSLSCGHLTPAKLIFALADYYQFSYDQKFIKENWQVLKRVGFWLVQNKPTNPCNVSLKYYEGLGWICASFKALSLLSEAIGYPEESNFFHQQFQQLWARILGFFSRKFKENHSGFRKDDSVSEAVAGLCLTYPLQLFQRNERFIGEWLHRVTEKSLLNGGVISPMEFQGVDLELTARLGATLLREGLEWEPSFNFLSEMAGPTGSWPDRIHPVFNGGIGLSGHAPGVCCHFLLLLRNIMIMEEGTTLYLLPGILVGRVWRGSEIELRRFPTIFGEISLKLKMVGNIIQIEFDACYRKKPRQIRLILNEHDQLLYSDSKILYREKFIELEPDFKIIRLRRVLT